jgi:hypothetical protein
MVATRGDSTKKARRREPPLDVDLSVTFRFGEAPEDRVTVIDQRRVPMMGSVFDSRDAVMRGFIKLLMKAAVMQPKVLGEVVPLFKRKRRKR